jgi:hypothetical protein
MYLTRKQIYKLRNAKSGIQATYFKQSLILAGIILSIVKYKNNKQLNNKF